MAFDFCCWGFIWQACNLAVNLPEKTIYIWLENERNIFADKFYIQKNNRTVRGEKYIPLYPGIKPKISIFVSFLGFSVL